MAEQFSPLPGSILPGMTSGTARRRLRTRTGSPSLVGYRGRECDMPFESWVEIEALKWAQAHQPPVSENRPYYATEAEWLRAEIGHLRGRLFDLETFWPDGGPAWKRSGFSSKRSSVWRPG